MGTKLSGRGERTSELTCRLHLRNRRIPKSNIHIRGIEHQDRLQRYMRYQHHIVTGQLHWEEVWKVYSGLPGTRCLHIVSLQKGCTLTGTERHLGSFQITKQGYSAPRISQPRRAASCGQTEGDIGKDDGAIVPQQDSGRSDVMTQYPGIKGCELLQEYQPD